MKSRAMLLTEKRMIIYEVLRYHQTYTNNTFEQTKVLCVDV